MIVLFEIIKIALFLALMLVSVRWLIPIFRWRRGWEEATSIAVAVPLANLFAISIVDLTGYLPKFGPAFRGVPGVTILGRADLTQPLESLGGFIIADGFPVALAMAAFVLISSRLQRRSWYLVFFWSWMIVSIGYAWLLPKIGLPDPSSTRYAKICGATIQLLQHTPRTPWGQGLAVALGAYFFMFAIVALCSQIRRVIKHANGRRYWPDQVQRSVRGRTMLLLVGCYLTLIATLGVWQKSVPSRWLPNSVAGAMVPDAASILFLAAFMLVVAGLTVVLSRVSGKRMAGIAWTNRRPAEIVCGLLFGAVAVAGWIVVSNGLGRPARNWQIRPSAQVLSYAAVILPAAVVRVLVLQGVLLQTLESYCNFITAAAVTSAGSVLIFGLQARTTWLTVVFLAAMCMFQCNLFRISGSLWCLAALEFGWTFLIGAVLQLRTAGLQRMGQMPSFDRPADWLTGGGTGPESGVASLLLICAGFAIVDFVEKTHSAFKQDGRLRIY
jgi:hypothetical protein